MEERFIFTRILVGYDGHEEGADALARGAGARGRRRRGAARRLEKTGRR
jgi:hypothetical protein